MACTSPLKAFMFKGNDGRNQKPIFYKPKDFNFVPYEDLPDDNKVLIPCGTCESCRLSYAQNWAVRCVLESLQHEYNYFVTLTYNDEHLPVSEVPIVDEFTGELQDIIFTSSLVPRDLQLFFKRLRRYFEYHHDFKGIRFYACGEYGSKNMRPHYHIILFNCPLDDLKLETTNFNGDCYYSSDIISRCWSDDDDKPLGFITVADCNYNTCSYVARYMLKKQKGADADFYRKNGLYVPFTRSSNKPGIARSYFDANSSKIYTSDSLVITGGNGVAKRVRPPKYFDKLYDILCPEDMQAIKDERKRKAEHAKAQILDSTSKDYDAYLSVQATYVHERANKLLRLL